MSQLGTAFSYRPLKMIETICTINHLLPDTFKLGVDFCKKFGKGGVGKMVSLFF